MEQGHSIRVQERTQGMPGVKGSQGRYATSDLISLPVSTILSEVSWEAP